MAADLVRLNVEVIVGGSSTAGPEPISLTGTAFRKIAQN
jgi:hypothetical protein